MRGEKKYNKKNWEQWIYVLEIVGGEKISWGDDKREKKGDKIITERTGFNFQFFFL